MPLDEGLADILASRGRGLAQSGAIELLLDAPHPSQRLSGLIDVIESCMLSRNIVVLAGDQPLALLNAAGSSLQDLTWHATSDREILETTTDTGLIWARSLERLAHRSEILSLRIRIDPQSTPSDASGVHVSRLRQLCVRGEGTGVSLNVAPVTLAVPRLRILTGTVYPVAGDQSLFRPSQELSQMELQVAAIAEKAETLIGRFDQMIVGELNPSRSVLVAHRSVEGLNVALSEAEKIVTLGLKWDQDELSEATE